MSLLKHLPELLEAQVITQETADKISAYYHNKQQDATNPLIIAFAVLGAILIGMGIILIIAHNWDQLGRTTKTILAFIPLLAGQALCGYTLLKKQDSIAWREATSVFLFFAIASCISLVGQIYNIPGNLSSFLLTWMLLSLPLVYIMKSSAVSLLYLIGITFYCTESNFIGSWQNKSYTYWGLLAGIFPYCYQLYKNKSEGIFTSLHTWVVPGSVAIALVSLGGEHGDFLVIAFFSLFGLYYLIGNMGNFKNEKIYNNGFLVIGAIGTIIALFIVSFNEYWRHLENEKQLFENFLTTPEFIAAVIISLLALALLILYVKDKAVAETEPLAVIFLLFILTFIIGTFSTFAVVIINLTIAAIGVLYIKDGSRQNHLGYMNLGLLIISLLILMRFLDSDFSFVIRGVTFVLLGLGFFIANYQMLKNRKANG